MPRYVMQIAALLILGSTSAMGETSNVPAGWPAPVRQVQHVEWDGIPQSVAPATASHHQHQILRAPGPRAATSAAARHHEKYLQKHPPHLSIQQRIQPAPAKLPLANQRETWKTPYSYGYFGASGRRHWSRHYGYRDRYTEWRRH